MSEGIFKLERKDDPLTLTIIHTREAVCQDARLEHGAARLFCLLLDFSLNPSMNLNRRGTVIISQTQLSERLNMSKRSVRDYIARLVSCGYLWVSKLPRPNMWPMARYHISALDAPKSAAMEVAQDGLWGNHARRFERPSRPPLAASLAPQGGPLVDSHGNPVSSFLLSNCAGSGEFSTLPEASLAPSQRQPAARAAASLAPGQRQPAARPAASLAPSQRQPAALTAAADCHLKRDSERGKDVEDGAGEDCLSVQRVSTRKSASVGRKTGSSRTEENVFLLDVKEVCEKFSKGSSKSELTNSGAWWRLAFRSDRSLMERVLGETSNAVKEGRIKISPGQFAVDLWKRWGGTLTSPAQREELR